MLGSDCLQGSVSAVAVLPNRSRSITAAAGCLLAKFVGLRSGWHILRLRSLGVSGRHTHVTKLLGQQSTDGLRYDLNFQSPANFGHNP